MNHSTITAPGRSASLLGLSQEPRHARTIGKYLVSPLIKPLGEGWFGTSVSIKSGTGSGTSDRVLRLTRLFRCATEAAEFAHSEGLRWIGASRSLAAA